MPPTIEVCVTYKVSAPEHLDVEPRDFPSP
jgi:hypothetical protein